MLEIVRIILALLVLCTAYCKCSMTIPITPHTRLDTCKNGDFMAVGWLVGEAQEQKYVRKSLASGASSSLYLYIISIDVCYSDVQCTNVVVRTGTHWMSVTYLHCTYTLYLVTVFFLHTLFPCPFNHPSLYPSNFAENSTFTCFVQQSTFCSHLFFVQCCWLYV